MRWDDFRRSDNVEDDRDGGGGFGGFGMQRAGGLGIGTVVVLGIVGWALGIDPRVLIGGAELMGGREARHEQPHRPAHSGAPSDSMGDFVAAVLGDTEDRWTDIFRQDGQQYRAPKLRLFSGREDTGCGFAQSAMGPFYCPRDQHVYLDTSFFQALETRFHGCSAQACKFSQAYVIAHEVGHHVQNLLGILPRVERQKQTADKAEANRLQVRVELQADCFGGVWANRAQQKVKFLDPGDVDAALSTASAIGDDTLQKARGRAVVPDAFTHGSSAQRQRWFLNGFKGGKVADCNTFGTASL